jgi:hypothetical protein
MTNRKQVKIFATIAAALIVLLVVIIVAEGHVK